LCGTGRVFKTTDRGENWFDTEIVDPGMFPMFRKLGVANNNIWVGAGNPNIYKSTNFGESWFVCDSSIGAFGISFINENTGFIGGGLNKLYKTTNGGTNFVRQRTDSTSLAFISSIDFVNDTIGWYSCAVGRIYKTTSGGEVLTNIVLNHSNFVKSFQLHQNYPNPFNSQTKISFTIKQSGNYNLEIYNNLGQRIREVFNKRISAGVYETTFDASGLNSGVYFYRLTGNNISLTKKFVLIK